MSGAAAAAAAAGPAGRGGGLGIGGAGAARRGIRLRDVGATPGLVATLLLLTVCAQLGSLAFIMLMLHLADGVMETRNAATLAGFAVLFLGFVAAAGAYGALRTTLLAAVAERFGLRLRAEALQAAVRSAVRTDAEQGVALVQDVAVVQGFLRGPGPITALEVVGAVVPLAVLFYFDRVFGLIGLAGIVGAALLGALLHRATRGLAADARRRMAEASADLGGQLAHPDLVRGLGMLWAILVRWQPRYDAALERVDDVGRRVGAVGGIEEIALVAYEMAMKGFALYLIFNQAGTLGLLMAVSFLSSHVVAPYSGLARSWQAWAFALQSWRRLREAMARDGAPAAAPRDPDAPPGLLAEGLAFHPAGRPEPIVGGLTLRLAPGTAVAVEGPNGVGKSTLLRLLLGLMPPTAGRVLLDGQDTWRCDRAALGARVGYLPQDVQLLEGNVFHNVGRGPGGSPDAVVRAARAAGAHEVIGRLPAGYQTPAGATSGLSAGQRRLIGLARALYGEPRLLVLDEPEVGLDGYARAAMRAAVADARARGAVVLIVTHEPDTWRGAVDLRLVLGAGGAWQVQAADDAAGPPPPGEDHAAVR